MDRERQRLEQQEKKIIMDTERWLKWVKWIRCYGTGYVRCKQLNLPQIQKIMMEFEKQAEIMDMKEEMMGDAMGEADNGEETEQVVAQVFDE
uniref:Uncharacterized protein n=1 Tax=Panagrolaimus sp. PS1159 TaxID=55785 RepID=A0AC35GGQ9_9BILA